MTYIGHQNRWPRDMTRLDRRRLAWIRVCMWLPCREPVAGVDKAWLRESSWSNSNLVRLERPMNERTGFRGSVADVQIGLRQTLLLMMIDNWILRMGIVLPLPRIVLGRGQDSRSPNIILEKMLQNSMKWIKNFYSRKPHFY